MLCQRCHKNPASVHIKQVINGNITEAELCSECASKENLGGFFSSKTSDLFSGFFSDSIFGGDYIKEQKTCPVCKTTRSDLAASGRPGCAKCYEVFEDELKKIIYGIHGNAIHSSARPGKHTERLKKNREIEALKAEQKQAVAEQNYEKAAELRDKIRDLEKGEED